MNYLVQRNVSAVSNKYNTTFEATKGYFTDINRKVQLGFVDTPGVTKANRNMTSRLLVSRAWNELPDNDLAIFVVDSVKRLDFEVREAVKRLKNLKFDPEERRIVDAFKSDSLSEKDLLQGLYELDEESKIVESFFFPSILVMNKVDLVTNKIRFKTLQQELEDFGAFEHTFMVSAETGYGMEDLKEHLISRAKLREWEQHPKVKAT